MTNFLILGLAGARGQDGYNSHKRRQRTVAIKKTFFCRDKHSILRNKPNEPNPARNKVLHLSRFCISGAFTLSEGSKPPFIHPVHFHGTCFFVFQEAGWGYHDDHACIENL